MYVTHHTPTKQEEDEDVFLGARGVYLYTEPSSCPMYVLSGAHPSGTKIHELQHPTSIVCTFVILNQD